MRRKETTVSARLANRTVLTTRRRSSSSGGEKCREKRLQSGRQCPAGFVILGQLRPRSRQVKSDPATNLIDLHSPCWSWGRLQMEANLFYYDLKLIRFEKRDASVF